MASSIRSAQVLGNSEQSYGLVSRLLHWLMVPLVWGLFGLGLYMTSLDYYHPWYHAAPWWHKSFGLLALLLLGLRFSWRMLQPRPRPLPSHAYWEILLARITHGMLYLLLLLICISGYLIATLKGQGIEFFDWLQVPAIIGPMEDPDDLLGQTHLWLAVALISLSLLHALAALKHHFVDRDPTLKRMLG